MVLNLHHDPEPHILALGHRTRCVLLSSTTTQQFPNYPHAHHICMSIITLHIIVIHVANYNDKNNVFTIIILNSFGM